MGFDKFRALPRPISDRREEGEERQLRYNKSGQMGGGANETGIFIAVKLVALAEAP